jgi:hypothetical protein
VSRPVQPYRDSETDQPDSTVTVDEESPRTSRIAFQDKRSDDQELPVPGPSNLGVVVDSVEDENDLASASDPRYHDRCSPVSLHPLLSEENAGNMGEDGGKSAMGVRGMCQHHHLVRFLLTATSSRDKLRAHGA